MKPAVGGILLITSLVALVGLVIAAGSSLHGALAVGQGSPSSHIRQCTASCVDASAAQAEQCARDAERCDLSCRGEYLDEGERILCQARCPSTAPCLRNVVATTRACVYACK